MKVKIVEIFHSIQGEAVYVGAPQVFVRFAGCDLSCAYCDTIVDVYDEYNCETVIQKVLSFKHYSHSIAITGGEPLLQVEALERITSALKNEGKKIFLETNGLLYKEYEQVQNSIDIVAMDIKLPSSSQMPQMWETHRMFLRTASNKDIFVKVVVANDSPYDELEQAAAIVAAQSKDIPFIIQPISEQQHDLNKLVQYADIAAARLNNVRVIGQMHKHMQVP